MHYLPTQHTLLLFGVVLSALNKDPLYISVSFRKFLFSCTAALIFIERLIQRSYFKELPNYVINVSRKKTNRKKAEHIQPSDVRCSGIIQLSRYEKKSQNINQNPLSMSFCPSHIYSGDCSHQLLVFRVLKW